MIDTMLSCINRITKARCVTSLPSIPCTRPRTISGKWSGNKSPTWLSWWMRKRKRNRYFLSIVSTSLCTIVGIMKEIIGIFLNISLLLSMVGSLLTSSFIILQCYPFQSSVFLNAPSRKLSWHFSYTEKCYHFLGLTFDLITHRYKLQFKFKSNNSVRLI